MPPGLYLAAVEPFEVLNREVKESPVKFRFQAISLSMSRVMHQMRCANASLSVIGESSLHIVSEQPQAQDEMMHLTCQTVKVELRIVICLHSDRLSIVARYSAPDYSMSSLS